MDLTEKTSSAAPSEIDRVMGELGHFKKQVEWLDMINQLHSRLAGVLSLSAMIEAYSVWLMPYVEHELIGYSNATKSKRHLFCSGHGSKRGEVIAFAEQIIESKDEEKSLYKNDAGHCAHKWTMDISGDAGILLILKEGRGLSSEQMKIINGSLTPLTGALKRALDYEELFERASNDELTGLANRRVFHARIQGMMDSASRYNFHLTMLSLDLDCFKDINDSLGHLAGDEVLKAVANVLQHAVRSSDLLVRMGGDEFVIVLDNTDKKNARVLAERLCKAVDELNIWADVKTKLGVSIGLAQMEKGEDLRTWMERVDDVLYHAKAEGKRQVAETY